MSTATVGVRLANGCVVAVFAWNVVRFGIALRRGFTRPDGVPRLMRLMGLCGAVAAVANGWVIAWAGTAPLWRAALALLILGVSQWVFRAAERATRAQRLSIAFSTDLPGHLNQAGPYRLVRHPFYLAYLLTWAGAAVATAHPASLAVLPGMAAFYAFAASQEEGKFLRSPLAAAYRRYQAATGRFLPRLTPRKAGITL